MDPLALLAELVAIPGPPGEERAVAAAVALHCARLGYATETDAKGNLLVRLGSGTPKVVVTAHLDEIALMVRAVEPDGALAVTRLGGIHPWKVGEGPVAVLAPTGSLNGVLSFGSIHTEDPASVTRQVEEGPLQWPMAHVATGLTAEETAAAGIRPGTRVVVHPTRRTLTPLGGGQVGSYFLDDRADLVAWLLALEALRERDLPVLFAATVSEEVGGEGVRYLLGPLRPDVCVALEIGPDVPDAPVSALDQPTVWVADGYAASAPADLERVARVAAALGQRPTFQALSRGGSDASCSAALGLCARPITLGFPVRNSHGYEIAATASISRLAELTVALLEDLLAPTRAE